MGYRNFPFIRSTKQRMLLLEAGTRRRLARPVEIRSGSGGCNEASPSVCSAARAQAGDERITRAKVQAGETFLPVRFPFHQTISQTKIWTLCLV